MDESSMTHELIVTVFRCLKQYRNQFVSIAFLFSRVFVLSDLFTIQKVLLCSVILRYFKIQV